MSNTLALVLPLSLLGLLACQPDNVGACKAYVEKANAAYTECDLETQLDPEEQCPDTLQEGADCTAYYEQLGDSYKCEDGAVDWEIPEDGCV